MDKLLEKQKSRIIALSEQKPANQNCDISEACVGNQPIIESVQSLEEKSTTEDVIKVEFSEPEALEDSIPLSELITTKIIPNKSKATKTNLPPIKKLQQSNLQPPQEPMLTFRDTDLSK